MNATWLIDADCDGTRAEQLGLEIRRRGFEYRAIKFFPDDRYPGDIAGAEDIPLDANVVFFGGMPLMEHIQKSRRWQPGGWCTFANLFCHIYYCYFGKHLLNDDYTLLPATEALRQATSLFARHGTSDYVFLRPSIGRKVFTGKLADRDEFVNTLSRLDPRQLIVISAPKRIGREWRLYVAQGEIVSQSQYGNNSQWAVSSECPDEVLAFGESVLRDTTWRPDPLFTMDICECEGRLRLVELNGFSCSNLYACDLGRIVTAASLAAGIG